MTKRRLFMCAALFALALAPLKAEAQLGKLKERLNKATKQPAADARPTPEAACATSTPEETDDATPSRTPAPSKTPAPSSTPLASNAS